MHANNIAFGIEIETHMPGTDATPIGGYHNGLPVAWLPTVASSPKKYWRSTMRTTCHPRSPTR